MSPTSGGVRIVLEYDRTHPCMAFAEEKKLVIESSMDNMPLGDRDGILADRASCQTQKGGMLHWQKCFY